MSHQTISFIKSGVRFLGYLSIAFWMNLPPFPNATYLSQVMYGVSLGAFLLIIAEIIGVLEEIGHE